MPSSTTVIAGLVYRNGVLIGADSQASDIVAGTRWSVSKLRHVHPHPLVVGFSGNTGTALRLIEGLDAAAIHATSFRKQRTIRGVLDGIYKPEYAAAAGRSAPPVAVPAVGPIIVHGLAAVWAEAKAALLEHEMNGDSDWHDHFHAIGSGHNTATAVFRALGGWELCRLSYRSAVPALLRILRTAIDTEMAGVAEPIHVWRVDAKGAKQIGVDELNVHWQFVDEWQKDDQRRLFDMDAGHADEGS